MSDSSDPRGAPLVVAGTLLLALATPFVGSAQNAYESLYADCSSGEPVEVQEACADAVLALQAVHGGLGFLLTAGGPLPSSPSTAGRRLATQPRIVADGGFHWSSFRHPDLSDFVGGEAGVRRSLVLGARATVVVGLFEGFSPLPGVGGMFSLDVVGQGTIAWLSGSDGFSDSATGFAAGVRLGVVRESFSLPGITVSALMHRGETTRYGATDPEVGPSIAVRPEARSIRAIVGKDLLAIGISGGMGWDRYEGTGRVRAERMLPGLGGPFLASTSAGPDKLRDSRRYLFLGANLTWLVAQLSGEISLSRERSPAFEVEGSGPFRPGSTEVQGALTVRVTY